MHLEMIFRHNSEHCTSFEVTYEFMYARSSRFKKAIYFSEVLRDFKKQHRAWEGNINPKCTKYEIRSANVSMSVARDISQKTVIGFP